MDDGGEDEEEDGDEAVCRGWEVHRKDWRLMMAGRGDAWSFDAESTYSLTTPLARCSSSDSSVLFGSSPSNANVNRSSSNLFPAGNESSCVSFTLALP
jgi:hypothetical protein